MCAGFCLVEAEAIMKNEENNLYHTTFQMKEKKLQ